VRSPEHASPRAPGDGGGGGASGARASGVARRTIGPCGGELALPPLHAARNAMNTAERRIVLRYNSVMARLTTCYVALVLFAAAAGAQPAQPKGATLPKAGDAFALAGAGEWPKLAWMYAAPSTNDAAGRVVVHWFCSPSPKKVATECADDLARIIGLRDTGHVYVVAYLAGSEREAKKLDPIKESEGIGKGTVAYGPGVVKLMKQLGLTEGAVVVDVDGTVKVVTTSGDLNELDARDKIVNDLIAGIKDFTTSHDNPATAKIGDKFQLVFKVQLASWLTFNQKNPVELFTVNVTKDVQCTTSTSIDGHTLVGTATCSGKRGVYEAQSTIRFEYESPSGGHGTGQDGATYKFEIK
jgi:hypothetical protein